MANKSRSVNRKKILNELKGDQEPERKNVTFSLPKSLLDGFKKDCEKNSLTMNKVVQKLIEDYMGV